MEYLIVRYAPMHGQINVGVVLFEKVQESVLFARAQFVQDMRSLRAFDPAADVDALQALFRDIERKISDPEETIAMLRQMQDSFSNLICVSDTKAILISGDPAVELATLASSFFLASGPAKLAS